MKGHLSKLVKIERPRLERGHARDRRFCGIHEFQLSGNYRKYLVAKLRDKAN
jgi:hypothetical protein